MLIEYAPGKWLHSYHVLQVTLYRVPDPGIPAHLGNAYAIATLVTGDKVIFNEQEYLTFVKAAQLTGAVQFADIQTLPADGPAIADLYKAAEAAEAQDGSEY